MNFIRSQVKTFSMAAIALTMLAAVTLLAGIAIPAQAQTESVLYSFQGSYSFGPDGAEPWAGPILVGTTLYGTTAGGGAPSGDGTVWSLSTTTGKETVLYAFQGGYDGWYPYGGLAHYKGSFYGTTENGGCPGCAGTVFKLTKKGKNYDETLPLVLTGTGPYGGEPMWVTPVFDAAGNLYGTTQGGGNGSGGVVFQLTPGGVENVLHGFNNNPPVGGDGIEPRGGVTVDKEGNVYGTTTEGGTYGWGTLYEITAAGEYSILYSFTNGDDGEGPIAPPVLDKKGNLWGTSSNGPNFGGAVYAFNRKTGEMHIVHTFTNDPDGASPQNGALVFDKEGNLYGTTSGGGAYYAGTIYKIAPDGTYTILYTFVGGTGDGANPMGNVVFDKSGNLYTTTNGGGAYGLGTVIKFTP